MAAHERGRKIPQNKQPVANLLGERKTPESSVPIAQRLKEFPGQSFEFEKKVFCRCCKYSIKNIKGTLGAHAASPTRADMLKQWRKKVCTQEEVKEFLTEHFKTNPSETMASMSPDELTYRFNVVETFLAAGLPPSKIDELKGLFRESVPCDERMRLFVPKVEAFEFERLKRELKGQKVTVIFDGTTRLGEAIAVLLRWCPDDFSGIQMRLVTLGTTEKHMDGPELGAFILNVLTTSLGLNGADVVGGARDSCSTNGVAMRNLKVVLLSLQDFLCVSHTLSKLGEHISLPTLNKFMTHWLGLVQHHPSAKRLWKEMTGGEAMEGYSTICWCSRKVVQNELAVKLGTHVDGFVDKLIDREIGDAHPQAMRTILDSNLSSLQNELALSLDLQRIIKVVHKLEGDTAVVLRAYDEIDQLLTFSDTLGDTPLSLPNLARLLRDQIKL